THQLGVEFLIHRIIRHALEPMLHKEIDLEGETEQPTDAQLDRAILQPIEERMPHTPTQPGTLNRKSPHLGEVLPHHVKRATANRAAVLVFGDQELLDQLIEDNPLLAEQDAPLD